MLLTPFAQPFTTGDAFRPGEAATHAADRVPGWPGPGQSRQYVHEVKGIGIVRVFVDRWMDPDAPDRLFLGPGAVAKGRKLLYVTELPVFVVEEPGQPGTCAGWFKATRLITRAEDCRAAGRRSRETAHGQTGRNIKGILLMEKRSDTPASLT